MPDSVTHLPLDNISDNAQFSVKFWKVERLRPYDRNARKIPDSAVDKVATSLKEFGWRQPIVADPSGIIVAGHTRLLAARKLGMTEVPVHIATGLSDAQIKAYRLMDNRSHDEAEWNLDLLAPEISELQSLAFDVEATGFDASEIDALLAGPPGQVSPTPEAETESEPEGPATSMEGDKWYLGDHLLIVGDSKKLPAEASEAHIVVFDPPFNVDYSEWDLPPSPVLVVWGRGDRRIVWEAASVVPAGYGLHELVITGGVRGQPRPELPCLVHDVIHVWRKRWWHDGDGSPIDPEVVRKIDWPKTVDDRHYSHKPNCGGVLTGLMSWGKPVVAMEVLLAYGPPTGLVYDPCAGSGSSLIACHRHGRKWVGCENQPRWADLAIERWEKEAGLSATHESGESFAAIQAARLAEPQAVKADRPQKRAGGTRVRNRRGTA